MDDKKVNAEDEKVGNETKIEKIELALEDLKTVADKAVRLIKAVVAADVPLPREEEKLKSRSFATLLEEMPNEIIQNIKILDGVLTELDNIIFN